MFWSPDQAVDADASPLRTGGLTMLDVFLVSNSEYECSGV
jgi:hypothetical protein